MKKLSLTVTIYIVLSLLFVIGNFTAVLASPGRIEDISFEAVTNWIYSTSDGDYVAGAQSTDWISQGTYSYKFAAIGGKIGGGKVTTITQSNVNFSLLDRFSFDCQLYADLNSIFEAQVWAGTTKVWSKAVTTSTAEYLRESVDVSAITTTGDLIFQIENIGGTDNYNMACYFDNIKIWGSHSDATFLIVENSFAGATNHAYMYGENFDSGTTKVGWYDGGGDWRQTDTNAFPAGGILNWSECIFTDYVGVAAAGDWHAVVIKTVDALPSTYAAAILHANFVADDVFTVDATAIPEFPEVMAAIGVAGLCFGIYWWMRKRARRVHEVCWVKS